MSATDETAVPAKKKKLPLAVVAVLLVAIAAGWWFFLSPKSAAPAKPKEGAVVQIDSIQVNLASGHYLRVGIALQLVDGAAEVPGAKALNETIATFSGLEVGQVNQPSVRELLRKQLAKKIEGEYDHQVMDVYLTDFVTQ